MVLTGLKRMRFVDQIQYADAISLSSWLCYFFGDWLSWESAESLTTRMFFPQFEAF
jgi:hypothetical protein